MGGFINLEITEILDPGFVLCGLRANDAEDVIRKLGNLLYKKGKVKKSFVEATIAREKEMPTGLPTDNINAAIPHADMEHVNEPSLAIGILNKPIPFGIMINPDESVEVSIVFLLALNTPQDLIGMLQKLALVLQNSSILKKLKQSKNSIQVVKVLSKWQADQVAKEVKK